MVFYYDEWLKGFFKPTRGLGQEDPLSPYLFIVIEEILLRLVKQSFVEGKIGPFHHPRGRHLFLICYMQMIFLFFAMVLKDLCENC